MRTDTKRRAPRQLGFETIYPPQQRMGEAALAGLLANEKASTVNKRSQLIIMQMQGGKTGAMQWLISLFIDDCITRRRTFQIVVFCGLPHLDLTAQTRDRVTESVQLDDGKSGLGAQLHLKAGASGLARYPRHLQNQGIIVLHNSPKLRRLDLKTHPGHGGQKEVQVDVRLFIGDEIHLGNVKDGNIDLFLRNHGVKPNEQPHTWDNTKTINHFVAVSATPSAHMLKSDNLVEFQGDGDDLHHWIYEPPPSDYNSLAIMRRVTRRIRQTQPLFLDNGAPSDFLLHVFADFHKACRAQGAGYLVIRATGKKHQQLKNYIKVRGRIDFKEFGTPKEFETPKEFDSKRDNDNIDELGPYLSIKPTAPRIVIIRGSMRAGITLGQDHYIRGWVEPESVTADTVVQSGVGRACGFKERLNDKYPIYCSLKHVDAWIDTYDALDKDRTPTIPSGIHNKQFRTHKVYGVAKIVSHEAALRMIRAERDKDAVLKRTDAKRHQRHRAQLASTNQVRWDIAGKLLKGQRDTGVTKGVHVNGSPTKKTVEEFIRNHPETPPEQVRDWSRRNQDSYKALIKKYPGCEGKVIIFDEGAQAFNQDQSRDGLQKNRSAVKR